MSGTRRSRSGSRFRICSGVAVGAVFIALLGTAGAAWDGQQTVVLGDSFSSAFDADPGTEVHNYDFYAPVGTKLKAKLKVDKEDNVVPSWRVLDASGDEVDLGNALTGTKIKNFVFAEGGAFRMEVTSTSGTGRYTVSTSGSKFPVKYNGKNVDSEWPFEAVKGQKLTVKVKGGPTITGLAGPFGPVDIGTGGATSLKSLKLMHSGAYTLEIDGVAKSISLKLKNPKKRAWYFDAMADGPGTPTLARMEWMGSGHADVTAEAFRHWDEDGDISTSCAACHSSFGQQDYVGADGTASNILGDPANKTDNPAALGSTVDCDACHNSASPSLDTVQFPSGNVVSGLGPEARCMQCHQGRESGVTLEQHITDAMVADDDTADADLRFLNVHYYAAGASLYGNQAVGAYQYVDKFYNNKFPHVSSVDACQDCHNQHTLELRFDDCGGCHDGANDALAVLDIRQVGSLSDYDGDGNTDEGIFYELKTMGEKTYAAMQEYAAAQGNPIVYDAHAYPYFFNDSNGNGMSDEGEANYGNRYTTWTARLLRAAYNYQYWQKDPGGFAHNGKYLIEVLYDTLENMNEHPSVTVMGFDDMHRNDTGHFDNTAEAFRHWDADGDVRSSCAQCHSPGGFQFTVDFGIAPVTSWDYGDGFSCEQCHVSDDWASDSPARRYVSQVTFPSGVQITNDVNDPDDSFLCMTCHQGRESKATVDADIASGNFSFNNIHYLAAGPTLYGHDALVGYEYDAASFVGAQTYAGQFMHAGGATNTCNFCHLDDHSFQPQLTDNCTGCHPEANGDLMGVRRNRATDYDGDGDANEILKDEVDTFGMRAFAALQEYATATGKTGIVYDAHGYPYFFKDLDGDGEIDENEANYGNRYTEWDAPMMKASFNIQMWKKEPGAWAHNTHYILQLLYDSIDDLQLAAADNATPLASDRLTAPTLLTRP